jgi:hypothetical protein
MSGKELAMDRALDAVAAYAHKAAKQRIRRDTVDPEKKKILVAREFAKEWMKEYSHTYMGPAADIDLYDMAITAGGRAKVADMDIAESLEFMLASKDELNAARLFGLPMLGLSWAQAVAGGRELEEAGIFLRDVVQD